MPSLLDPRATFTIRLAVEEDLPAILSLIGADPISASRPGHSIAITPNVTRAFLALCDSTQHSLCVAERGGEVIGTYQLSLLPGLTRDGMWRALVESVHVRADCRNAGVGKALMQHAIKQARTKGCGMVQLTSDKRRLDAHRFYQRLGFIASHEGMKLTLD